MLKLLSGAMLLGTIMAVSVPISKNNQPTNAFSEQGTSIKASPRRLKSSADFKAAEETVSSKMASILGMKPVTVERTKLLLDFAGNEYFIEHSTGRHYCGCGELMTC